MSWIAEVHESAAEGRLKECYERIVKALGRMIPFYRVFSSSPRLLGAHLEFSGALGTYRVAAVVVVRVRPLLGENQTNSFEPWPFTPADSISGPLVPLSLRSAFRARFASCLALR